ncbi:hypothetical protein ACFL1G_10940 [Planctomycetota bacterium]
MLLVFDCDFSKSSYGFRPGRSAHKAVLVGRARVARKVQANIRELEEVLTTIYAISRTIGKQI